MTKPTAPSLPPARRFRPHRKLFIALGILLFAWLVVLLILYFTTIYPTRGKRVDYPGEAAPAAPANPS